jgi:hypothetical protein
VPRSVRAAEVRKRGPVYSRAPKFANGTKFRGPNQLELRILAARTLATSDDLLQLSIPPSSRTPHILPSQSRSLGWAILVPGLALLHLDRNGGSDHRLGLLLARLGAGRASAMTTIDAPVQPRSSRLRRFGTGCLGLALTYLCFEWTRIGAITQALHPNRLQTLSWLSIAAPPWNSSSSRCDIRLVSRGDSPGRIWLFSTDRVLWVRLYRIWPQVLNAMVLVEPATVVQWHRKGFRTYWRWRSRRPGRPKMSTETRDLIRQMSLANPLWGRAPHPRRTAQSRHRDQPGHGREIPAVAAQRPSPTRHSFLHNHT